MHYFVVTGSSRGIGLEIVKSLCKLLGDQCTIIGVSRSGNCVADQERNGAHVVAVALDLSQSAEIVEKCFSDHVWPKICRENAESISVVLNAGFLAVGEVGVAADRHLSLAKEIAVNATAPLVIVDSFARRCAWPEVAKRQVCAVSSGLAKSPAKAMAGYCASKAALELGLASFDLEQREKTTGGIVTQLICPGIVHTDMQLMLNSSDHPSLAFFRDYKKEGKGFLPSETGLRISQALLNKDFGKNFRVDWFQS